MQCDNLNSFDYDIQIMTKDDAEEVKDFMVKFFYAAEPICQALKMRASDFSGSYIDEAPNCCRNGYSLKAVRKSGEIIGIMLNSIMQKNEKENDVLQITNSKLAILDKYLKTADARCNVFQKFPDIEKVLHLQIIAVNPACRNMGIGYRLIDECRHVARKNGLNLIAIHCTSTFTAKVAKKLGYEEVFTMKYDDFTKSDGTPYFKSESPHDGSSIYVLRL